MTIDFEKDQEQVLDKTTNINKLADKIKELQAQQEQLQIQEDAVKQKKKDIEYLSGEVIPTMLSEMGLSFLKLQENKQKIAVFFICSTLIENILTFLFKRFVLKSCMIIII